MQCWEVRERTLPGHTLDYLVLATGMGGAAGLNGDDGRFYWFKAGDKHNFGLISSSLANFVETTWRLQIELRDLDLSLEESHDQVAVELRRLVAELRPTDLDGFDSPVVFWQHVIFFALRRIAAEWAQVTN